MTQVAPASAPAPAPAPRSVLPIAGALALAAVVVLALWGSFGLVVWRLRHSRAGRSAVAELRVHPQVQALVGTPVRVRIEDGDLAHAGHASFSMIVRGPRGELHAKVQETSAAHTWRLSSGTLTLASGEVVPLQMGAAPASIANPAVPR